MLVSKVFQVATYYEKMEIFLVDYLEITDPRPSPRIMNAH